MAGNQDGRVLADADIHGGDFRITISLGVGFVQQSHALYAVFPGFQGQSYQVISSQAVIHSCGQSPLDEGIHFFIILQQYISMLRISGQALQAVSNRFPQGTDIFVFRSQDAYGLCFSSKFRFFPIPQGSFRQGSFVSHSSQQFFFLSQRILYPGFDGVQIEVGVRNGGEQVQCHHVVHITADSLAFFAQFRRNSGQALRYIDQQILHSSDFRFLAADTGNGAAFAACSFLTLKAEHFVFHFALPFSI